MTVSELLSRISSKELTKWMAFSELEPFGSSAFYYGHAMTTSMLANIYRKKGAQPSTPSDFVPTFERPKPQSVDEMIGMAANITQLLGGKDKRK